MIFLVGLEKDLINDGDKGDIWVPWIVDGVVCTTGLVILDLGGMKNGIRSEETFSTIR